MICLCDKKFELDVQTKSRTFRHLITLFESNEENLVENDKVLPPTSAVWSGFTSYGQGQAYTAALRWWSEKPDTNKGFHQNDTKASMEISMNSKDDSTTSSNATEEILTIKFSIVISNEVWKTIEPCQTVYRRKIDKTTLLKKTDDFDIFQTFNISVLGSLTSSKIKTRTVRQHKISTKFWNNI